MNLRTMIIAVLILLIGAGVRLFNVDYALSTYDLCLTPAEEVWLYRTESLPMTASVPQIASIFHWNMLTQGGFVLAPRVEAHSVLTLDRDPLVLLSLRLIGVAVGLVTIGLTMLIARRLRSDLWALAGLFVAAVPPFALVDRWVLRFDYAPFVVALAAALLVIAPSVSPGWRRTALIFAHTLIALSLFVIAPPLWWVAIGLIALMPYHRFRVIAFVAALLFAAIPALQTIDVWVISAGMPDSAVTAALILIVVFMVVWRWQRVPVWMHLILLILIIGAGAIGLFEHRRYVRPTPEEWELVHWLQERTPDQAVVRFDNALFPLADVVACPLGANITYQPHTEQVMFFDTRTLPDPLYTVTTNPSQFAAPNNLEYAGNRYWVENSLRIPNPWDYRFGDVLHLLGYSVDLRPDAAYPMIDIRLDIQFSGALTPDALAYGAFIHVTTLNDPGTKWLEYSEAIVEESGGASPRRIVTNHHIRLPIPSDLPAGQYQVLFGMFNYYTGERLNYGGGDFVTIGYFSVP